MALFYKYPSTQASPENAYVHIGVLWASLGLYIGFKECCIRVQLHYITLHLTDVVDVYAI